MKTVMNTIEQKYLKGDKARHFCSVVQTLHLHSAESKAMKSEKKKLEILLCESVMGSLLSL